MTIVRRALVLTIPLLLVTALTAAAGPPWISIEYPANPLDPETRGALMVVRTYHHEAPRVVDMSAEAIGTIDGRRSTSALQVQATSRPGVYAVRGSLPESGAWVLRISSGAGDQGATALVALNDRREVIAVEVPHRSLEGGRWLAPRPPADGEVEALLRTASAMTEAARSTRVAAGAGAALLLLVLAPSGAWLARRHRGTDAA